MGCRSTGTILNLITDGEAFLFVQLQESDRDRFMLQRGKADVFMG